MTFTWLVLFIVLVFIELVTVNLVTIWFVFGSLVSFFVSLFFDNTSLQVGIFVVVSFIALLLTKNIVNKVKNKQIIPTNLDRVIGKIGIVTETISPLKIGEVKVDGKLWSAISEKKILKNKLVKVKTIKGVKLVVEEVREEDDK